MECRVHSLKIAANHIEMYDISIVKLKLKPQVKVSCKKGSYSGVYPMQYNNCIILKESIKKTGSSSQLY